MTRYRASQFAELLAEALRLLDSGEQGRGRPGDDGEGKGLEDATTVVDAMYALPTWRTRYGAAKRRVPGCGGGVARSVGEHRIPEYTRMSARRRPGTTRRWARFTSIFAGGSRLHTKLRRDPTAEALYRSRGHSMEHPSRSRRARGRFKSGDTARWPAHRVGPAIRWSTDRDHQRSCRTDVGSNAVRAAMFC